ncbi:Coiled-coil domain-containing protein 22 [Ilyodon furcidens]|uniref:Coiled-coil domain-containing protein 22 n=1 Tax=Ilyodon furcidens TaxID=33524 RepID=A0ABV0SL83_9TELE
MEEVDKILIHALRQVGTEVGEDIDRVNQFTSELIVEAVGKCIRVIDPGLGGALPTSLPPGMSARFRVGMSLAQACQVNSVSRLEHITPSGQGCPTICL